LDVNSSVPYAQIRQPVQSPGKSPPSAYSNSGYPGNIQYDNSGHHVATHSRSQSQEHSPQSQSSYSFHDSSSSRYSSETSSVRSSGVFSGEIQNWVGNVGNYFSGSKEPTKPSDAEIENLFLDLMNKRDLRNLSEAKRKQMLAIPTDKKWTLIRQDIIQEEKTKSNSSNVVASAHEKNTPEYFIKKIMDGTITVKDMNSLSVSLRTLTLKCVKV